MNDDERKALIALLHETLDYTDIRWRHASTG